MEMSTPYHYIPQEQDKETLVGMSVAAQTTRHQMAMSVLSIMQLRNMKEQQHNETLVGYTNRFKLESMNVGECDQAFKVAVFMRGLNPREELFYELMRSTPETVEELMQVAEKFARGEEADLAKIQGRNFPNSAEMLSRYPELLKAKDLREANLIGEYMNELPPGELNRKLARDPPTSLVEFKEIVEDYTRVEEAVRARFGECSREGENGESSKKRKRSRRKRNRNNQRV